MEIASKYWWRQFENAMAERSLTYKTLFTLCVVDGPEKLLLSGSEDGEVFAWKIGPLLGMHNSTADVSAPFFTFVLESCEPIFKIVFSAELDVILLATSSGLLGWRWNKLTQLMNIDDNNGKATLTSPDIAFSAGNGGANLEFTDIALDTEEILNGHVLASCGNGTIYRYDLGAASTFARYSAHNSPVHSLRLYGDGFVSGGEDGRVLFWDVNSPSYIHSIEPSKAVCGVSSAITSLSVGSSSQWLVAGCSAGFLCSYHLQTRSLLSVLPTASSPLICKFMDGRIVSAGSDPFVSYWNLKGDQILQTELELPCIYDVALEKSEDNSDVLFAAGCSPRIGISVNQVKSANFLSC